MNKLLFVVILVATVSLVFSPTFVNAEIKLTPPPNWQPGPNNNSTSMIWVQNSTKSVFGIIKPQFNTTSSSSSSSSLKSSISSSISSSLLPFFRSLLPLILPNVNSFIAQMLADQGVLESTDQTTFGKSNYGYRYFVNLNPSSLSKVLNSSDTLLNSSAIPDIPGMPISPNTLLNSSAIPGMSPGSLLNSSAIPGMLSIAKDVPFKGMFIIAMKQGDFYAIFFASPKETFDSKLKEIQPTLDSIELSNSTALAN